MEKRPRDPNQLGKLIVDIATGEVDDDQPKSGKSRGGVARAESLSPERRREIATGAAKARWKKHKAAG